MKPLVIGGIFVVALAVLVGVGVESASIPVVKLAELHGASIDGAAVDGAAIRGTVRVNDGKVLRIESTTPLRFEVCPRDGGPARITVVSDRTAPENFQADRDVGLEGEYDPESNTFRAYKITTQCPSRYEASREVDEAPSRLEAAPGSYAAPLSDVDAPGSLEAPLDAPPPGVRPE